MEGSPDEHAVLLGGDLALAADADAARMADDLADHVLGRLAFDALHVGLPAADRPLGDVIGPDVGSHRGRGFAVPVTKIEVQFADTKR